MKVGTVVLAVALIAVGAAGKAEARTSAHRHGYCGYHLHFDYSHDNMLSAFSYIYPAANWGPFFQCHLYYSPVLAYQPLPYRLPY